MAATVDDVKLIIPQGNGFSDEQIQAALDVAGCMLESCTGMSDACYNKAQAYLSAHILTVQDNRLALTEEKFENATNKYQIGTLGTGIMATRYGQTANALTGGCLAQKDKNPVNFYSIGGH